MTDRAHIHDWVSDPYNEAVICADCGKQDIIYNEPGVVRKADASSNRVAAVEQILCGYYGRQQPIAKWHPEAARRIIETLDAIPNSAAHDHDPAPSPFTELGKGARVNPDTMIPGRAIRNRVRGEIDRKLLDLVLHISD